MKTNSNDTSYQSSGDSGKLPASGIHRSAFKESDDTEGLFYNVNRDSRISSVENMALNAETMNMFNWIHRKDIRNQIFHKIKTLPWQEESISQVKENDTVLLLYQSQSKSVSVTHIH